MTLNLVFQNRETGLTNKMLSKIDGTANAEG